MERWQGRVAVVTGASAGIGATITVDLVKAGMIVVGLARRKERIDDLQNLIPSNCNGKLYALKCDISKDDNIVEAFKWIELNVGRVDVLVNNAGISRPMSLITSGNEDKLKEILQINLWGLILSTKKAFEIMKRKNINDGHIININSVCGHKIVQIHGRAPATNIYSASKYGVTALTEVLRQELAYAETKIRVTSISPGAVRTERFGQTAKDSFPFLETEDISSAVLHALSAPPHVQIHEIIIKPIGEMF